MRRPSPAQPQVIAASGTKTAFSNGDSYFAIPGPSIGAVVGKLDAVVSANRELQKYHRSRADGADASSD
jgi:energy-converting hydrogenase Eha subunit A